MGMLTPLKLGVRFDPPSIILIYRERGKLRKRQIPVKNIDILTDISIYAANFKKDTKYKKFFDKVTISKIEKIVFILQDNMKGYTLTESLERAKKYDDPSKNEDSEISESLDYLAKKKDNDDYDDDDFHDTEDEEDFKNIISNTKKIVESTPKKPEINMSDSAEIEDLIGTLHLSNPTSNSATKSNEQESKLDSLNLLSNQIKTVKSSIYDFEDDVESDSEKDDSSMFNKFSKKPEEIEEKIETAEQDESDESF